MIRSNKPQREVLIAKNSYPLKVNVFGYDNTVRILTDAFRCNLSIYGVENTVIIEEGVYSVAGCSIQIGDAANPVFNTTFYIGKNSSFGNVDFLILEDDSEIRIGEDCLFSSDICVWCTDSHAMFDEKGEPRQGRFIHIGNHVWVGLRVMIGKNTNIPSGCMVGWGSVVTGRFSEENSLIAGVPAAARKYHISWQRERPSHYVHGRKERLSTYADWNMGTPPGCLNRLALYIKLMIYRGRARWCKTEISRNKWQNKMSKVQILLGRTKG